MKPINVGILSHNDPDIFLLLHRISRSENIGDVIVLDDHSEPEYVEFIKELVDMYGFGFSQRRLEFNFSAQRNALLDMLPFDQFVMFLDADEYVRPDFFLEASRQIEVDTEADSFRVWRRNVNIFDNATEREGFEQHIRLFNNVQSIRYQNKIHEGVIGCRRTGDMPRDFAIQHIKTEAKAHKAHLWYDEHFYRKGIK